jgi:hypothetical protein
MRAPLRWFKPPKADFPNFPSAPKGCNVDLDAFLKEAAKKRAEKLRQEENASSGRTGITRGRREERKIAAVEVVEILDPVEEPVRRISRSDEGKESSPDARTSRIPKKSNLSQLESRHLAEEEEDKLERHVQQAIDHAVGTLPKLSEQAPQSMSGAIDRSEAVRDLIRDPKTLRAALIVSEILKRPKW